MHCFPTLSIGSLRVPGQHILYWLVSKHTTTQSVEYFQIQTSPPRAQRQAPAFGQKHKAFLKNIVGYAKMWLK